MNDLLEKTHAIVFLDKLSKKLDNEYSRLKRDLDHGQFERIEIYNNKEDEISQWVKDYPDRGNEELRRLKCLAIKELSND